MQNLTRPIAFIDLETTGTSITQDRIAEIAIHKYDPVTKEESKYQRYVNPERPMHPDAAAITGYTDEFLSMYMPFRDIAAEVFELIKDCDIAGHNIIRFDVPMLEEELERCGLRIPVSCRFIDTMRIEEKLIPKTLAACYLRHTGKVADSDDLHGAEFDAYASKEVFIHQVESLEHMKESTSIEDLHKLSTSGKDIVDFSGKFMLNADRKVVYAFGKNEGKPVSSDMSYCSWMLGGDFTQNTKLWIPLCIKYHDDYEAIINHLETQEITVSNSFNG